MVSALLGGWIGASDGLIDVVAVAVADVSESPSRWIYDRTHLSVARTAECRKNDCYRNAHVVRWWHIRLGARNIVERIACRAYTSDSAALSVPQKVVQLSTGNL
jgi:hypothetical protein